MCFTGLPFVRLNTRIVGNLRIKCHGIGDETSISEGDKRVLVALTLTLTDRVADCFIVVRFGL